MSPYRSGIRGEQRVLLHRVADAAPRRYVQGDRFTATLGTDLLEVTYELVVVRMDRVATPKTQRLHIRS